MAPTSLQKKALVHGESVKAEIVGASSRKTVEDTTDKISTAQANSNTSARKGLKRSYSDSFHVTRAETLAKVVASVSDRRYRKTVLVNSCTRGRQNDAIADAWAQSCSSLATNQSCTEESDDTSLACEKKVVQKSENSLSSDACRAGPIIAGILSEVFADVCDSGSIEGPEDPQAITSNEVNVAPQRHNGSIYSGIDSRMASTSVEARTMAAVKAHKAAPVKAKKKKAVSWAPDHKLTDVRHIDTRLQLLQSWNPECRDTLPFSAKARRMFQVTWDTQSGVENDLYTVGDIASDGIQAVQRKREPYHMAFYGTSGVADVSRYANWSLQDKLDVMLSGSGRTRPKASVMPVECHAGRNTANCRRAIGDYCAPPPPRRRLDGLALTTPLHTYFSVYGHCQTPNGDVARTRPAVDASRASEESDEVS